MNHNELTVKRIMPQTFSEKLNNYYDMLCSAIRKNAKNADFILEEIVKFLKDNWDLVGTLSKENLYMVLNCIVLAKSQCQETAVEMFQSEQFQNLRENYRNSR